MNEFELAAKDIKERIVTNAHLIIIFFLACLLSLGLTSIWIFFDPSRITLLRTTWIILQYQWFMIPFTVLLIIFALADARLGLSSVKGANPSRSRLPLWEGILVLPLAGTVMILLGRSLLYVVPPARHLRNPLWAPLPEHSIDPVINGMLVAAFFAMLTISSFSVMYHILEMFSMDELAQSLIKSKNDVIQIHNTTFPDPNALDPEAETLFHTVPLENRKRVSGRTVGEFYMFVLSRFFMSSRVVS